jgi:hypothetical protein
LFKLADQEHELAPAIICKMAPGTLAEGAPGVHISSLFDVQSCKRIRGFVQKSRRRNGLHVGYSMTQNAHRLTSRSVRKFPQAPEKSSDIPKLAFVGREPAVASGFAWPTLVVLTAPG